MSASISVTYLWSHETPHRGYEIFVDQVSIAYLDAFVGPYPTMCLAKPLEFLGLPAAEALSDAYRESLIDETLETSRFNLVSVAETWAWDDRAARGELDKYAGVAA